jgi:RNA polymerase sigma factor (sigma-70 family)
MADNKYSKTRFTILTEFKNSQLSLRSFISRYVISPQDIDDVSQETFLRAYKAEKDKEIEHPKAFLFRIAKNLMLSEFSRKARKITDYIEDCDGSEEFLNTDNLESNVMAQQKLGIYCEAVASLPTQCRRVVIMKKVYGMQNKEIARRLELSVSTVEKHLTKGIRRLNSTIISRYPEQDTRGASQKVDQRGRNNG